MLFYFKRIKYYKFSATNVWFEPESSFYDFHCLLWLKSNDCCWTRSLCFSHWIILLVYLKFSRIRSMFGQTKQMFFFLFLFQLSRFSFFSTKIMQLTWAIWCVNFTVSVYDRNTDIFFLVISSSSSSRFRIFSVVLRVVFFHGDNFPFKPNKAPPNVTVDICKRIKISGLAGRPAISCWYYYMLKCLPSNALLRFHLVHGAYRIRGNSLF